MSLELPWLTAAKKEINDNGWRLKVHEAALDEDLHGNVSLDDARGHLTGGHLRVDKKVIEETVCAVINEIAGSIALGDQPGLQSGGLVLADGIHQRGSQRQPCLLARLLSLKNAQSAGRHALGADFVRRHGPPAHNLRAEGERDGRADHSRRSSRALLRAQDRPGCVIRSPEARDQ
jgi:hypothetical protein